MTFEEEFPSLKPFIEATEFKTIPKTAIRRYCLDKQRIKEVIDKVEQETNNIMAVMIMNKLKKELRL